MNSKDSYFFEKKMSSSEIKKEGERALKQIQSQNKNDSKKKSEYVDYLKQQFAFKQKKYEDQKKRQLEKIKERGKEGHLERAKSSIAGIRTQKSNARETDATVGKKTIENIGSVASGLGGAAYHGVRYLMAKKSAEKKAKDAKSKQQEKKELKAPGRPKKEKRSFGPTQQKSTGTQQKLTGTPDRPLLMPAKKSLGQRARENPDLKQKLIKKRLGEDFSNWKEELIVEVESVVGGKKEKKKVIEILKGKVNKITINPNIDESYDDGDETFRQHSRETFPSVNNKTPSRTSSLLKKMRELNVHVDKKKKKKKKVNEENIQEFAMLVPIAARIAGGAVARGVATKVAGSAASGTSRSRVAELLGQKAGQMTADIVKKKIEKRFKNEDESIEESSAWSRNAGYKDDYPSNESKIHEDHKEIASGKKRDKEGYMARVEFDQIERSVSILRGKIKKGNQQLPAWVQSKITRAADFIDTAAEYMQSDEDVSEGMTRSDFITEVDAWQRKEGKNSKGGLNEKGRKSYEKENPGSDLKAPSKKVGNPRRKSFCARMSGMKAKLTSAKTARDPDSRINKSLRAWNC